MKKVQPQRLSAETVESSALSFESVDDVQRGDSLSLGVLSVGDRVTDDVLEEDLQDTSGLWSSQLCVTSIRTEVDLPS